ncbi:hypothetical protein [Rheinheimera metallidurans]|uniref:general secretion pathway protein GspK n=1 Tax=Rheinheimera metallidurans TaxID=2925781 RepID=UPI00300268CE
MTTFKPPFVYVSGVALVQVLFITSILSLMALHFTLTSRAQVNIASTLQDKITAELMLMQWQNELFYALLTQPIFSEGNHKPPTANILTKHWNFYGKTFSPADNVQIRIQDIYGMLSLATPGMQTELSNLLQQVAISGTDAQRIVANLQHWQGFNSNTYQLSHAKAGRDMLMQNLSEFKQVSGITELQFSQLAEAVVALPNSTLNPLTAPDIRLKAMLAPDVASKVIQLREQGQLDAATYIALTGIEDYESLSFVPGQRFLIEVKVAYGESVAKSRFICYIRPENQFPLIWLD